MSATREIIMDEIRVLAEQVANETDDEARVGMQRKLSQLLDELKKFPSNGTLLND